MVLASIAGLAAANYFACIISVPPLVIQIQQRNIASSVLIISILIKNLMNGSNALIWHSRNYALWWDGRVFCDIEIKLAVALQIAILGAATCVFRQLGLVFHSSLGPPSRAEKTRTKLIELTFCIAIPVFRAAAIYLVQPDRYWIIRMTGCIWTVDSSWPSYVLVHIWELPVSITGLVYAAITTIRMIRHQRNASSVLGHQNSRNKSRVVRLYCLGLFLFLTFVPLQIYNLYHELPRHLVPYSWSRIHPPDWSERILMFRASNIVFRGIIVPYAGTLYSIAVAILVGLTPDAINSYKGWFARFQVWRRRLSNKMAFRARSSSSVAQHHHNIQSQTMGRLELEALSVGRQDQEVG